MSFAERFAAAGAVFDEETWPIEGRAAYRAACGRGRARMAGARVAVCGLVRDAEADLPRVAPQIERLTRGFADHRVVLYENDSRDGTRAWLARWAARDPRVVAVSEALGRPRHAAVRSVERAADMAEYRSRLQAAVLERCAGFDYVIVLDTDLYGYDPEGVAHALGLDGWDALGAKGLSFLGGAHFACPDVWAFRFVGRPEGCDSFTVHDFVPPRGAARVPVLSCFGGMAIYRMEAFRAGRYAGGDCEHVTFHASLARAGHGRIFMSPSLLTLYPDLADLYPRQALRALARRLGIHPPASPPPSFQAHARP